jgi:hypothetical protein
MVNHLEFSNADDILNSAVVCDMVRVLNSRLSFLEACGANGLGLEYRGPLYRFKIRFYCLNEPRVNIPDYFIEATNASLSRGYLVSRVKSHLGELSKLYAIRQIVGIDNRQMTTVYMAARTYTDDQKSQGLPYHTFDVSFDKNQYAASLAPYAAAMKRGREESSDTRPISDT